jgi:hypothetical protein
MSVVSELSWPHMVVPADQLARLCRGGHASLAAGLWSMGLHNCSGGVGLEGFCLGGADNRSFQRYIGVTSTERTSLKLPDLVLEVKQRLLCTKWAQALHKFQKQNIDFAFVLGGGLCRFRGP